MNEARSARPSRSASAIRSSSVLRTSSAGGPWPSSTTRHALTRYMAQAVEAAPGHPILVDHFLEDAIEIDVDAVGRRHGRHRGRRDGAHRAGRHPLRRFDDRDPAVHHRRARSGQDPPPHGRARESAERHRPDERAVRDSARRAVRAGSESARVAHRAVRLEGDRRAVREDRREGDGRPFAALPRPDQRAARRRLLRQGAGLPVQPLPARRHGARPGDEVDRRSDGQLAHVRRGLRESAPRRGHAAAARRHGVHLHQRQRQAPARRAPRARAGRPRLPARRHRRHARVPA